MESTEQITGLRMVDVRVKIAQVGQGIKSCEKHNAGDYTYWTVDGRSWRIWETPAGTWKGALA